MHKNSYYSCYLAASNDTSLIPNVWPRPLVAGSGLSHTCLDWEDFLLWRCQLTVWSPQHQEAQLVPVFVFLLLLCLHALKLLFVCFALLHSVFCLSASQPSRASLYFSWVLVIWEPSSPSCCRHKCFLVLLGCDCFGCVVPAVSSVVKGSRCCGTVFEVVQVQVFLSHHAASALQHVISLWSGHFLL